MFPEDEEAVQCADTTSDTFILSCFLFMCNKFTQDGKEEAPHIPEQECDLCPSLLTGPG